MKAIKYPHDRQRLVDLLLAYRAATDVRLYPTIWRVLSLLTSRVWEAEKDACLWEAARGELNGFAMLWRRRPTSPYLVLDWIIHPGRASYKLVKAILEWGSQRAQEIATVNNAVLTLYTSTHAFLLTMGEAKQSLPELLTSLGFDPHSPNSEEHNVYFAHPLVEPIPVAVLPPGHTIRRLQSMVDLEDYQSLYGFAAVNPLHFKEQLESGEYAHWVVMNPAGEFAAYCECSIWRSEWEQTSRRIGWIDYVETKETERGKGLGRFALLSGLAQLQAWGAETAMLVTINTNAAAVRLYEKTGFEQVDLEEPQKFEKKVEP